MQHRSPRDPTHPSCLAQSTRDGALLPNHAHPNDLLGGDDIHIASDESCEWEEERAAVESDGGGEFGGGGGVLRRQVVRLMGGF